MDSNRLVQIHDELAARKNAQETKEHEEMVNNTEYLAKAIAADIQRAPTSAYKKLSNGVMSLSGYVYKGGRTAFHYSMLERLLRETYKIPHVTYINVFPCQHPSPISEMDLVSCCIITGLCFPCAVGSFVYECCVLPCWFRYEITFNVFMGAAKD